MEKVNMVSKDIVGNNIEKIGTLFPNCITEVKNANGELEHAIDFDKLKQELSRNLVEGKKERYEFTWPDKRQAIVTANAPISKTLRPVREKSVDFDNTQNVYIEGDNLDALKLLQETYLGKIKMIYIDPPYNTGNDFVYEDDFSQNADNYLKSTGDADEQGNRLTANKDSNGRFHTDWLNMMYPRLKLAKDLLTDDGIILFSINDIEVPNARKILDEIFGSMNFVDCFIWYINGHTDNQDQIITVHEYILAYCKNLSLLKTNSVVDPNIPNKSKIYNSFAENSIVKNGEKNPPSMITLPIGFPCEKENLIFSRHSNIENLIAEAKSNGFISREMTRNYKVEYPARFDDMVVADYKLAKECRVFSGWMNNGKLQNFINSGCTPIKENDGTSISFYLSKNGVVYYKREGRTPKYIQSVLQNMGTTETNKYMLEEMGISFDYPKPLILIKYLVSIFANREDIVLDFFSGSATTAHAVMKLNAEDGGTRNFILIQLPEKADGQPNFLDICDIGEERIRRAGKKIKGEAGLLADNLDVGFRVFKIDDSNMKDVYYQPESLRQEDLFSISDNIKDDRTPEDLLFQVMIDDFGIPLSAKIEKNTVSGKTIFNVENNFLVACFDSGVTDEVVTAMAKLEPKYAVLRDSSYEDDSVAANFEQIFNKYSPSTTKKVL